MRHASSHRRPILLALALAVAWGACAGASDAADSGLVGVFVSGSKTKRTPEFRWTVRTVEALREDGSRHPLGLTAETLLPRELRGRQVPLASGSLPAGLYRGLLVSLDNGRREGEGEDATGTAVRVLNDFRVVPRGSLTLVLRLDLGRAVGPEGPDAAAFVLDRTDGTVVRGLTLYVTDERADRVVAVNRNTDEVFSRIPVGAGPRGIDVTADGRTAYVAASRDDRISVVDTSTHATVDSIPLRPGCAPEDVALARDGSRLAVSCRGSNLVVLLDPRNNARIGEVSLAGPPGRLAVSRGGETVYALVPNANQVVSIEAGRVRADGRTARLEAAPSDLVVDRLSGKLFVSHAHMPVVSVIDRQLRPQPSLRVATPGHGMALERDGRRLYLAGGQMGGVTLVGTAVGTLIRRWNSPPAFRPVLDPDGRKIYLAGGSNGTLLVLDRIAGRMVGEVRVGDSAIDLVVIP